jgi:class 3 adenylate cyclase
MSETRKIAAILVAHVVGYSRLTGADEERTLARLRALRSDLIDPAVTVHHGHVVKRTGDGVLVEFRSVVDALRCAVEVQDGMVERNAGLPPDRHIQFRIGVHLAMSSRRPTGTSWAMASISPRGLRPSATTAASVYRRTPIARPATRSKMRSSISASKP